ncbi:hypothetical protein D3C84_917460 [compost metagenome]
MGLEPGIEQRHGDGIGFFTGGTRQAEDPQGAHIVEVGQAPGGQFRQRDEGFRIPEKPGFRDDHRFDQRLLLFLRTLQNMPILIGRQRLRRHAALAYRTLDDRRSHRSHVQTDAFLEEIEEPLVTAHGRSSSSAGSSGGDGNSSARTGSVNRSATRTHCSSPCASSRTGPR